MNAVVVIGPLAAAGIGALLSFVEIYNKRGAAPRRGVFPWVLARLSIDASISAAVYPAALSIFTGGSWWWASAAAGVGAPALLRMQLNIVSRGGTLKGIGPELLYRRLRETIDGKINRQMSSKDSSWVINVVSPAIARIPPDRLLAQLEGYFRLLKNVSGTKMTVELDYLKSMSERAKNGESIAHEALAFRLLEFGQRELVTDLVRAGKSYPAVSQPASLTHEPPRVR